ncbi:hypothetical protein R6Q59_019139 [Mikania micrantha]
MATPTTINSPLASFQPLHPPPPPRYAKRQRCRHQASLKTDAIKYRWSVESLTFRAYDLYNHRQFSTIHISILPPIAYLHPSSPIDLSTLLKSHPIQQQELLRQLRRLRPPICAVADHPICAVSDLPLCAVTDLPLCAAADLPLCAVAPSPTEPSTGSLVNRC